LGQSLEDFEVQPCAPQIQLSLLQRLGEPSFLPTKLMIHSTLRMIYQEITERAESLALE